MINKVDVLAIGGAMANTFLKAQGKPVGASLVEDDLLETAREILQKAQKEGRQILLPLDVVVAEKIEANALPKTIFLDAIGEKDMILDICHLSQENLA